MERGSGDYTAAGHSTTWAVACAARGCASGGGVRGGCVCDVWGTLAIRFGFWVLGLSAFRYGIIAGLFGPQHTQRNSTQRAKHKNKLNHTHTHGHTHVHTRRRCAHVYSAALGGPSACGLACGLRGCGEPGSSSAPSAAVSKGAAAGAGGAGDAGADAVPPAPAPAAAPGDGSGVSMTCGCRRAWGCCGCSCS